MELDLLLIVAYLVLLRMVDSIYKQFREGKALASVNAEMALMKQQKLIEFANAIGINDSRLVIE